MSFITRTFIQMFHFLHWSIEYRCTKTLNLIIFSFLDLVCRMASEGSCEIKPGCSSWPAGEDGAHQPGPGAGENGVAANPEHVNLKVLFKQFSEEN